MIDVVTFDLWNTLFDNKSYMNSRLDFLVQFLENESNVISSERLTHVFNTTFYIPDMDFEQTGYRHIYTRERLVKLLNQLNIDLNNSEITEIVRNFEEIMLNDPPLLRSGVKDTLIELSRDYKIGLISNTGITPGRIIKQVFEEYKIQKYFRITLFSDETGWYKPNPIMFKPLLKQFNTKPQNAIHIGDKLETDVKGASECKMLTIWLNDSNAQKSDKIKPDYEIKQIFDSVRIIKSIK